MPVYAQALIPRLVAWTFGLVVLLATLGPKGCALWPDAPSWLCSPESFTAEALIPRGITVFTLLFGLFNTYLWRTKLGRLATKWPVPDISGTWRGTLTPGAAPDGVPLSPPIPVYLVIYQSAFKLRAFLYTKEARSQTLAAEFTQTDDELHLVYTYRSTPNQNIQDRSPIHEGTTVLLMRPRDPDCLNGYYFTQRLSRGELSFDGHSRQHAQDFAEASQALTYRARELPCIPSEESAGEIGT